jgi:hypothetical protein
MKIFDVIHVRSLTDITRDTTQDIQTATRRGVKKANKTMILINTETIN